MMNEMANPIGTSIQQLVPRHHDVARAGGRLRSLMSSRLGITRQVVTVNAEIANLFDGLVELDPVVQHPRRCIRGPALVPPALPMRLTSTRDVNIPYPRRFLPMDSNMLAPPSY